MKKKPVWPWLVFAVLLCSLCIFGCGMLGAPVDSNRDGRIDAREAAQPVASTVKTVVDTVLPQAKALTDQLYYWIFGASIATGAGATYVSKRGSKKRHEKTEEKFQAQIKVLKDENKKLRDFIVEIAKKSGVPEGNLVS